VPAGFLGLGSLPLDEVLPFSLWWRDQLAEGSFLAPSWPVRYGGRGLGPWADVVIAEELARRGLPDGAPNDRFGIQMLGNTLLVHGSEAQRQEFLPAILAGERRFAQGYSEPNAGSDLASLTLRAERDGDRYRLFGQKTWSSEAHLANWMFVLARTEPYAPRHRGISFLLVPLTEEGIEVRPIRMLSGRREFNEVFFDGAIARADHMVGARGGGWPVAMTLLGFERGAQAATLPIRFQEELARLVALAQARGVPLERIADRASELAALAAFGRRVLEERDHGVAREGTAQVFKLAWSAYHQRVTEDAVELWGEEALVPTGRGTSSAFRTDDPGAPNSSQSWVDVWLHARAGTIYAGTSEIQRTILGERVLGLAREPR
jgi:alkylation response protein AidB-like acyl-CoA dehydrogenase